MIELKQLKWSNLFSYGKDNSIHFNSHPVVQLLGSNGNGKSSIALILEECLFNKNSKGIKKGSIPNRFSKDKSYSIELEFSKDKDNYTVSVSRKGATQKVTLIKNDEDISSHTATDTFKEIESILGIDSKTFSQLIYQSSTSSLEFLTATDTNRKRFLIDLFDLDEYVKIYDKIKELAKEANEQVVSAESKFNTISSWLDKHTQMDLSRLELLDIPDEPKELIHELSELKARASSVAERNKKIIQNNQYKSLRDKVDLSILSRPVPDSAESDLTKVRSKLAVAEHTLTEKTTLLGKFNNLVGIHTCPTCLREIKEDQIKLLLPDLETEISEITAGIKLLKEEISKLKGLVDLRKKQKDTQDNFEKYSLQIDSSLPTTIEDKDELDRSIKELSEEITKTLSSIKTISDKNAKISGHNSKVDIVLQQIDEYKSELQDQKLVVDKLKDEFAYVDILKKSFSTNGLIAYKIENLVRELEDITNEYLTELSGGKFQLSFSVQNDKLNVIITDNGIDVEISALSSGEKARVNTATLLAIRKLMSSISKTKINLLILDETISTLDTDGKEKLVELLLGEPELNTFIVSHDYTHPLLEKVTIVKEGNISKIEHG